MTREKTTQRRTPWLRIYTDLSDHRKTILLADLLDIEPVLAVGHLVTFWHHVLVQQESGDLSSCRPKHIARWASWDGDPDVFMKAMIDSGWIDRDGDVLRVHDWFDYVGPLLKNRARVKATREGDESCTRTVRVQRAYSTKPKRKRKSKSTDKEVFASQTPGLPSGSPDPAPAKKRSVLTKECEDFCRYYATQVGFGKGDGDPHLILEAFRSRKKLFSPLQLNRIVMAWVRSKEWAKENGTYRASVLNFLTKERYTSPPSEAIGSLAGADYSKDDEDVR